MTNIEVISANTLQVGHASYRCAVGKSGFIAQDQKQEGDNKTPIGCYTLLSCWYRPDKMDAPATSLPIHPVTQADGWCDAPTHPSYNQHVTLPFFASHETLWREDDCYDLLLVIDHNTSPAIAGKGSAIFIHIAKPDFSGTEGCIALAKPDLLSILLQLTCNSQLIIHPQDS